MKTVRDTKRGSRQAREIPSVAIAGYTNAGKSSLLNRLTGAGVLVQNQLFATLDPTVRRAETPDGREYTLADTVGSSVSCRPSSSRPSGPPWRRWAMPTCCSTSSTARTPTRGPDLGGPLRPRRRRRGRRQGGHRRQQGRHRRSRGGRPDPAPREARHRGLRPHRPGHGGAAATHRRRDPPSRHPRRRPRALQPGDLVSRVHDEADLLTEVHVADGTRITAAPRPTSQPTSSGMPSR